MKKLDTGELRRALLARLHYSVGKPSESALPRDWCVALTLTLRDQIVDAWMESYRKSQANGVKRVYYLSMEYLIGRLLSDAMLNLGLDDTCRQVLAEFGVDFDAVIVSEPDAALGNGGLGRLAACFMDSMATLGIPAFGYGIRYQHGLFRQRIADGWQVEQAENWLMFGHHWEFERPEASYIVNFGGDSDPNRPPALRWDPAESVVASANDTPVPGWGVQHVNTLRLWAAKPAGLFDLSHFNQGDYLRAAAQQVLAETITQVLYPDDSTEQGRELRLKQEYFATSASLQDLLQRFQRDHNDLRRLPDSVAIQLNDTHPAIAVPELMRLLIDENGIPEDEAFEITRECVSYTNHTLLPEALERWPMALFASVLPRHLQLIEYIDRRFLQSDAKREPEADVRELTAIAPDGSAVRMGNLAFIGSRAVNGVSELHTSLMKKTVFRGLHAIYPDRIVNVTNGITPRRWLYNCNPYLRELLLETVGDGWIADLGQVAGIAPYADDAGFRARYAEAKRWNKVRLAEDIRTRCGGLRIDPDALFDVQVKRIHEYKRQLLNALQTIARYYAIRENPEADWVPVVKIFSGKAAPSYTMAKYIIKLINDVAATVNRDPLVGDRLKVVYLPDYNVSRAELVIPGADLSEQISTAGMEASGTGNMKLALNGALTIGTLDGANIEIRDRIGAENVFVFGLTAEEVAALRRDGYDPRAVIEGDPVLRKAVQAIASGEFSNGDQGRFGEIVKDHLYAHRYGQGR